MFCLNNLYHLILTEKRINSGFIIFSGRSDPRSISIRIRNLAIIDEVFNFNSKGYHQTMSAIRIKTDIYYKYVNYINLFYITDIGRFNNSSEILKKYLWAAS